MPDPMPTLTAEQREEAWQAIVDVRDAHPRHNQDAPTDAILEALAPLIARMVADVRGEAEAGAADDPGPVNAVPTPAQLLRRLFDGTVEQRLEWAYRAIENAEVVRSCFMQDHLAQIARLKRMVADAGCELQRTGDGTHGPLIRQAKAEGRAEVVAAVEAVCDRWDGYGHGVYNTHLEEQLPCPACDLLADLRTALAEANRIGGTS